MAFTAEQLSAINLRDCDLLVSAAAGSGKTTVLVERILSLIAEGVSVDHILIVTFTRAASADMRAKLQKKLEEHAEDPRYKEQLDRLPMATIGTLHSFCASIIREYFEAAGVDPAFRLMESYESEKQAREIAQNVLNDLAKHTEYTDGLNQLFCSRSSTAVLDVITELFRFVRNRPDYKNWVSDTVSLEAYPSIAEKCANILMDAAVSEIDGAISLLREALNMSMAPDGPSNMISCLSSDLDFLEKYTEYANVDDLKMYLSSYAAETAKRAGKDIDRDKLDQVKKLREEAKKAIKSMPGKLYNASEILENMRNVSPVVQLLSTALGNLWEQLDIARDKTSSYDYSDLELRAIRALQNEQVAAAVRNSFDAVFVDEYQDVSEMQEALLKLVARPGKYFMVGDVKQSIYRFRLAEPGLFLDKQKNFTNADGGKLIHLNKNFRSRGSILAFTNKVFNRAMNLKNSEIAYTHDEELVQGNCFGGDDPKIRVAVINAKTEESEDDAFTDTDALEGGYIASYIHSIVGTELNVSGQETPRKICYKDIVILSRTRSRIAKLQDILNYYGIPSFADTNGGYTETMEMRHVLSFLGCMSNMHSDVKLLSVMLGPEFDFSPEDIARLRINHPTGSLYDAAWAETDNDDRYQDFFYTMFAWRNLARNLPLTDFLQRYLWQSGFYAYVGAMPDGKRRQANLDLLCEHAEQYAKTHAEGINGFLELFEVPKGKGDAGEAQSIGEGDDVVRLMTIHKSKGLEFPVVIGTQLERKYAGKAKSSPVFMHKDLGFSLEYRNASRKTKSASFVSKAIESLDRLQETNEEMRLLYVLMTRASDRLLLIGRSDSLDKHRRVVSSVRDLKCSLDLIIPCLTEQDELEIVTPSALSLRGRDETKQIPGVTMLHDGLECPADEQMLQAFNWIYPNLQDSLSPLKLTVTSIAKSLIGPAQMQTPVEKPDFLGNPTRIGMHRGSSTHDILSRLDLCRLSAAERIKDSIEEQLKEFKLKGILSAEDYRYINREKITAFFESAIGKRMIAAKTVRREWPFTVYMPSELALGPGRQGPDILVQGVIDCCFLEEGKWVLLDYKTDHGMDESELRNTYGSQLMLYKYALEKITGIEVSDVFICHLSSGNAITIA